MSMPTFSKQLTNAIDNYERLVEIWDRTRAQPRARWTDLKLVGDEVRLARARLVLAIKAEFRGFQHEVPSTVECLAWYDHLVSERRPLIFKGE